MTPTEVYTIFKRVAPEKARDAIQYKRYDSSSIVVRMMSGRSFIFKTDPSGDNFEFVERKNVK